MKDLNKAIGKAAEAFANLVKSIVEMARSLVNILLPVLKSNNWRKLHRLPMRGANEAMWQKKNPYLEYMIALLRGQKEGIQLGDSEIRGPKTSEPASEGKSSGSQ